MQSLEEQIRDDSKSKAGSTCCIYWLICCCWWIYFLPTVKLFSISTFINVVGGMFLSSIIFGGILYIIVRYCVIIPIKLNKPNLLSFTSIIGHLMNYIIAYPIYKTSEYCFKYINL